VGLQSIVDASVVTLSKALGSVGAAVCASKNFCHALVNYGRAYIYSTGVPAWVASGAVEAIGVMRDEPERSARVRALARRVREAVGAGTPLDSPIAPIVLGEEARALGASQRLLEAGVLVLAVRPPTVPKGGSRLRVTLSCDHLDEEVSKLLDILTEIGTG
jgi:8-amino-7-oxononanoate synthase